MSVPDLQGYYLVNDFKVMKIKAIIVYSCRSLEMHMIFAGLQMKQEENRQRNAISVYWIIRISANHWHGCKTIM